MSIKFYNMKTRTLIIILTLSFGLFTACTDKKKAKEKPKTEIISEENKAAVENTVDEAKKRRQDSIRQDSIRQVEEHGHAH